MKGKYKAKYQLYRVDEKLGPEKESIDFEKDGYASIEDLKEKGPALVEEQIKKHGVPDCEAMLDLQIVELVRNTEVYVDNDSVLFTIKNGKMTDIGDN